MTDFPDPAADNVSSGRVPVRLTHSMAEKNVDTRTTFQPDSVTRRSQEPISRAFASNLSDLLVSIGEFFGVYPVQDL